MKIIRIIISVIIFLSMLVITLTCYSSFDFNTFFFAGGSYNYMMSITDLGVIYPTLFLIISGLLLFFFIKKPKFQQIISLLIIIALWLLSGRTIGLIGIPDTEKIVTGWFYMPFEGYHLCTNKDDVELMYDYYTTVKSLPFWRIEVKNKNIDQIIFVGPFRWSKTLENFHKEIPNKPYP